MKKPSAYRRLLQCYSNPARARGPVGLLVLGSGSGFFRSVLCLLGGVSRVLGGVGSVLGAGRGAGSGSGVGRGGGGVSGRSGGVGSGLGSVGSGGVAGSSSLVGGGLGVGGSSGRLSGGVAGVAGVLTVLVLAGGLAYAVRRRGHSEVSS